MIQNLLKSGKLLKFKILNEMKKTKFNGLNFESLEVLSKEEQRRVVGGYGYNDGSPNGQNLHFTMYCLGTTNGLDAYEWYVYDVRSEGCCSSSAAQTTCSNNRPNPAVTPLYFTTC